MRISVKGRYAIAAILEMSCCWTAQTRATAASIADTLGISKIYLEQVFTRLKNSGLIISVKGAKGGYFLSKPPTEITIWDVLASVESSLTEKTENTVSENAPQTESAMQNMIFSPLDHRIKSFLSSIAIKDVLDTVELDKETQSFMLNI